MKSTCPTSIFEINIESLDYGPSKLFEAMAAQIQTRKDIFSELLEE